MATPNRRKGSVAGDRSEIIGRIPKACADEFAAVEFIEAQRWGSTPCCPHCGDTNVRKMMDAEGKKRNARFLWRCMGCRKQYTVRVGTVYEESRIPLRHWCYAFWASVASKKGVSAMQIKRMTGLNYRSALFLLNRIRHAMAVDPTTPPKLTGTVEADETYVGGKPRHALPKHGPSSKSPKTPVFAVVQRGGDVRARVMPTVTSANIRQALMETTDFGSRLITDEHKLYVKVGRPFGSHERVKHSDREYVRLGTDVHSNTIEGFFSLLKRGIIGTFHSVSPEHLHRYVSEFEFRYNTRKVDDGERLNLAIRQASGKRLMYRENTPKAA